MGKATIIEAQNSNTVYEDGKAKGILGKLKGIFADYKHGTRNSDRLYTEELWDNRVFGSEDVMEALETKTLFGELDHPEGDRCETLAKNAAISITKLEKKSEDGVIYGEADILDTPTGRIVKALADSGAKLGISSRGMGEEVYKEGKNIIDPDTYDFITFDVVVTPANTKARVALAESKHIDKLTESFKKEIDESSTENQLNQLKAVLENVSLSNKDKLMEQINVKKNSFNTSNKFIEENQKIAIDILKEKLKESLNVKNQLNESLKANEDLTEENSKLLDENKFYKDSREQLKNKYKELCENISKKDIEISSLKESIEDKNKNIDNLNNKLKIQENSFNKNLNNIKDKYNNDIKALKEDYDKQLLEKDNKLKRILNENQKISKNALHSSKILTESNNRSEKLEESNKQLLLLKEQYEKTIESLKLEIADLKQENEEARDIEKRFSKLAFDPIGTVKVMPENFNEMDYNDEDKALYQILTNKS